MLNNQRVAIIIPFYNEEKYIGELSLSLPDFIDKVIFVNDCSTDRSTKELLKNIESDIKIINIRDKELETNDFNIPIVECKYFIIHHSNNKGKGAAIKSGYKLALKLNVDCIATIDGDGQMDLSEIKDICKPITTGEAHYAKGNRLSNPNTISVIPKNRLYGIYILTIMTRLCSGYWHINDTQTGFTAIQTDTLKKISLDNIYNKYGYVNDMIIKLSAIHATVVDVPVTPIYRTPSESKMNIYVEAPKIFILMIRLFTWKFNLKLKNLL